MHLTPFHAVKEPLHTALFVHEEKFAVLAWSVRNHQDCTVELC